MAKLNEEEMLEIVEKNISKLENKEFNVYFFVMDTKNVPSGSLEYIYKTALILKNKGYNVTMLYQGSDFVGVEEWYGKEYAELEHKEIEKDNVEIGPADFLFIPEIFANVMVHTKQLPCKRVMIIQNYDYLAEFMPVAVSPDEIGIIDAIITTKEQETKVKRYFPNLRTHIVSPSIENKFRPKNEPQKLIVNIVSREQSDASKIIKPFYWQYPLYKWVTFRDLRGLSQDAFCEALRDGAITVWIDERTNFGYSALEAMRCGSILIAKTTDHPSDWMLAKTNEDGTYELTKDCLWFDDLDTIPDLIANVVRTWTLDKIPQYIYDNQQKFDEKYTTEQQEREINDVYVDYLFKTRLNNFIEVREQLKNKGLTINK